MFNYEIKIKPSESHLGSLLCIIYEINDEGDKLVIDCAVANSERYLRVWAEEQIEFYSC